MRRIASPIHTLPIRIQRLRHIRHYIGRITPHVPNAGKAEARLYLHPEDDFKRLERNGPFDKLRPSTAHGEPSLP